MNLLRCCFNIYTRWCERRIRARIGYCAPSAFIHPDNYIVGGKLISISDDSIIQPGGKLILTNKKWGLKIGRWVGISYNVTIINSNHIPTVGVPQHLAACIHLNDKDTMIEIDDDCWIAANVTLLPGAKINRGCVVGAGALVNKEIPPYAVVAGVPAKIVAVKFSLEQIMEHERYIYPENERLSKEKLNALFEQYYKDKKTIGTDVLTDEQKLKYSSCCKKY